MEDGEEKEEEKEGKKEDEEEEVNTSPCEKSYLFAAFFAAQFSCSILFSLPSIYNFIDSYSPMLT